MGHDEVPRYCYYHFGSWFWRPTRRMRAEGFRRAKLGPGVIVDGLCIMRPAEVARAVALNQDWDRHRHGLPPLGQLSSYPPGSIGDGYTRAMALRAKEREARGIIWTREHHSRNDYPRAWKRIEPLFGDCDPKTVTPEMLQQFRADIGTQVSESEAHRVIKIWRALWKKMARFGFCELDRDPALAFTNSAPEPRQHVWLEGEAVRLVKEALRSGYFGMGVLLAVAWDTQLSPIDARKLSAQSRRSDRFGTWFEVQRAKTGRPALATLSPRSAALLNAYLKKLPAEPVGAAPLFRNRSGRHYSKDTLGDDFRAVRAKVFGPEEKRQIADFRRSGATEALAGNIPPEKLSSKMANTLSASNRLHRTYAPVQLASVRDADDARRIGRAKLREQKSAKSIRAPVQKYPPKAEGGAK